MTKYVILDSFDDFYKARPYTRVRRGRLERVKGYQGRAKSFEDTTVSERMKLADWKDIKTQMIDNILGVRTAMPDFKKVPSGAVPTSDIMQTVSKNMKEELSTCNKYLAGDTVDLIHKFIGLSRGLVTNNLEDFKGVDSKVLNSMFVDSVRKLIHQEVESNRQQFTDHGIRHIVKNITTQNMMLDVLDSQGIKISPREKLLANFIMVNHDMGYTTPFIRSGGLEAIKASKEHSAYSKKIAEQQKSLWNIGKVFTEEEYDRAVNIIASHDSTDMSISDTVALTTRLADNLSLFQAEKLPSMFEYVPGSENLLLGMGLAAKRGENAQFEKYRDQLYHKIDKVGRFSDNLKRDLKAGVKEISYMTPKFTVGVLAGEIKDIGTSKEGLISIEIKHNKFDATLQKFFDMGQRQVKKFLGDYGEDFSSTGAKSSYLIGKYGDKALLELKVV